MIAPIEMIVQRINEGLHATEIRTLSRMVGSKSKGTGRIEIQQLELVHWSERRKYAELAIRPAGSRSQRQTRAGRQCIPANGNSMGSHRLSRLRIEAWPADPRRGRRSSNSKISAERRESGTSEPGRSGKSKMPQNRKGTGFRGPSPDVGKATQFKAGTSGNPGGRPKRDIAAEIAQLIFEKNGDEIYCVMSKALGKATMPWRRRRVRSANLGQGLKTPVVSWPATVIGDFA
jgi:hypothetical protein